MKKITLAILVCLISSTILVSCGPSESVQTIPTPLPTESTPSPSPTRTLTPTYTPTATVLPSSTPKPIDTPFPLRDLANLVTPGDLPQDFEMAEGGPIFLGIVPTEETFAFYDRVHGEAIIGSAMRLDDQQDRDEFDALVANKSAFLFFVLSQLESSLVPGEPIEIEGIGDVSFAFTADESKNENQFHWDALIFRRNDVGIIIAYLYLIENTPTVSLEEIAAILDNHIQANPEFGQNGG